MENQKPTLSDVKEYFKNAEIIQCAIKSISVTEDTFHFLENENWYTDESGYHGIVWDKGKGYAKILTYKNTEPKFEITKEQILELSEKFGSDNSCLAKHFLTEHLKRMFPEVFENKKQIGKWYNHAAGGIWKIDSEPYSNGNCYVYGFTRDYKYFEREINNIERLEHECDPEKVTEVLKNEAVRRGFKEGVWFNSVEPNVEGISFVKFGSISNDIFFSNESLFNSRGYIFKNGKWAEIIPTKTIQEAEELLKELGHNFKIV